MVTIEQIKKMSVGEAKARTEQEAVSKAISEMLFKQNYKARQEALIKELFKDD